MRRRTRLTRLIAPGILVGLAGCAADSPGAPNALAAVHSDSAGVDIVLNAAAPDDVPVFATLAPTPTLRLGALTGRPEEQFGAIADVEPLPDGGVAVLDGQAAEVRVFDGNGAHRATLGERGDGPGELRSPVALASAGGDSLAVFDRRSRRVTRFALDGGVGAVTTLRDAAERPVLDAVFLPGGGLVARSPWTADPDGRFDLPPAGEYALVVDSARLATYGPAGDPLGSRDGLPNAETVFRVDRTGPALALFKRPAVFGRSRVLAGHADGVWAGYNDRFELRLYDVAGLELRRVIRAPGLERPASGGAAAAIRAHADAAGDGTPGERRNLEGWFGASPRPARQPAYDRVVVDDRGRLWVREWSGAVPSTRWWIFAAEGDLLGSATAPAGVTLYDVRCNEAWGVLTDELGVGYVVRHAVGGPAIEGRTC